MLKRYLYNGSWFWFEEGEQPEGAIEEKAVKQAANKEAKPANKARRTRTKRVE